jgi:hypothetical protein
MPTTQPICCSSLNSNSRMFGISLLPISFVFHGYTHIAISRYFAWSTRHKISTTFCPNKYNQKSHSKIHDKWKNVDQFEKKSVPHLREPMSLDVWLPLRRERTGIKRKKLGDIFSGACVVLRACHLNLLCQIIYPNRRLDGKRRQYNAETHRGGLEQRTKKKII